MEADLILFAKLILWLWDNHERPWEYRHEQAKIIYDLMQNGYQSISNEKQLEDYLPTQERINNRFPRRTYLYLNPVTNDQIMVPVLSLKYNFGCSVPEFRCRLGLFLRTNNSLKAVGYRFESPEGEGVHHYYHVQIIRGLSGNFPPLECSEWLPESQPAFPINAKNPIQVILCLLVTLYGIDYISQLSLDQYFGSQVREHVRVMSIRSTTEVKWYWKVQNRKTGHTIGYRESTKHPDEQAEYKKMYPGCDFIPITQNQYKQSPHHLRLN